MAGGRSYIEERGRRQGRDFLVTDHNSRDSILGGDVTASLLLFFCSGQINLRSDSEVRGPLPSAAHLLGLLLCSACVPPPPRVTPTIHPSLRMD